jgi:hypothetical protein
MVASFLLGGSLSACSIAPEDTGQVEQPFATTLVGEPVHEEVTAAALGFLRPEILAAIQAFDTSVDVEFVLVNANHFDDCNFSGGATVIRGFQAQAVAALDPAVALDGDAQALAAFGRWLHTAQDFYAHTNWVESGGQTIAEGSLTPWAAWSPYTTLAPSGFVLVQGTPPRRTSVTRHEDAPYPENAVVRVKSGKTAALGVISGSVDYEPGDFCPASVRMSHDDLNKDFSDTAGREAQHIAAKSLAVQQTHHEWCRLVAMARAAWGDAGQARLLAWAADPASAICAP